MNLGLQGKVAIVTGASRGIGNAIAHGLADEGCKLTICARGEEALASAAAALREKGAEVVEVCLDITDADAGEVLTQKTLDAYGSIDVFVGNAGGNRRGQFADTSDQDWQDIIELNLKSHLNTSRAVLPTMKQQGSGSIIFITSIFGREAGGPGL